MSEIIMAFIPCDKHSGNSFSGSWSMT